jgi:site-specific DNA recombinase
MATWHGAKANGAELTEATAREALVRLNPLWEELFPAEQGCIVHYWSSV